MSQPISSSITLRFSGLDADQHRLDAEQYGKSIAGTAKLYNTATHLFYNGEIPSGRTIYKMRTYTSTRTEEGSICAAVYSAMVTGEMAVYPKLWKQLGDLIVPQCVKAVYAKLVRRDSEVKTAYEKCIQIMQEDHQREREHTERLTQMAFTTFLQSQSNFTDAIKHMADTSRGAARDSVETVGRSSLQIEHLSSTRIVLKLDQPIADSLRSKEKLEVTDPAVYYGKIIEADKHKKSCRVLLDGHDKPISARINDPVIEHTGNIYTHALDQDLRIRIEAKSTMKDDEIKTLYISHAEKDSES